MPMHPEYETAQQRFRDLLGYDYAWGSYMLTRWVEALAKDPTGLQCIRMVEDLEEQNREMKG